MTEKYLTDYVKTQLGVSWVDVEVEKEDMKILISQALDKVAPYYEGKRYVQATGKIIDLSIHNPTAITNVWNCKEKQIMTAEEYAFGGSYVVLFDSSTMDRLTSYLTYKMLYNELQYDKGMNFKYIYPNLYLDGYYEDVVIEMTVRPKVLSDIEEESMYYTWVKEYVLALAKELLGRVRGKFNVEGSPYTMDSAQLLSEAQTEKANLESKLVRRNLRNLKKGELLMSTNKLFESYTKGLNEFEELTEKINKDNIEINKAIANPNAGRNRDKIRAAGYETQEGPDGKTFLIKNPKTNKSVNPSIYNRDGKGKVDFKGKLDSDRPYKGKVYIDKRFGGKGKMIPNRAIVGKNNYGDKIANTDDYEYYSSHSFLWDNKPNYTSISKNVRDYKDAVKTRDDSTKSAERGKDNINYYVKKVKQAQEDLDRENQWIKDKEQQASDAEEKRKSIIDNIRKRKTESEELNESKVYRDTENPSDYIVLDDSGKLEKTSAGEVINFGEVCGFNKVNNTTYLVVKDNDSKVYLYSIQTGFPFTFELASESRNIDESEKLEEKRNPENDEANKLIRNSLNNDEYAKTHTTELRKHGIKYIPPEKDQEWRGGALEGKEGRRLKTISNDDVNWYKDRADKVTSVDYDSVYSKGYLHNDSYADKTDLHQKTYKDSKAEVVNAKSKVEKQRRKNERLKAKGELTFGDRDKLDKLEKTIEKGVQAEYTSNDKIHPDTDLKSFLNAKKHSDRPLPREKDPKFKRDSRIRGKGVADPANKDVETYKEVKSGKDYISREKERNAQQDKEDQERINYYKQRAKEDKARRDEYIKKNEKEVNKLDSKLQKKLDTYRKRMANK